MNVIGDTLTNKEWKTPYNDFNSMKALVHVKYWESIVDGVIPPPIMVSIDPMAFCNFNCSFCNATSIMKEKEKFNKEIIDSIVKTLRAWGTKVVCVGGGGESTLHKLFPYLLDQLRDNEIDVGVVTNGFMIDKLHEPLLRTKWVGVSIDAGIKETYSSVKGVKLETFEKVLDNMREFSLIKDRTTLSYKYLIHPTNFNEIYQAVSLAKEIGCDYIHLRPGGDPWFELDRNEFGFSLDMVDEARSQIVRAREDFEDEGFRVYGILHKFTGGWRAKRSFANCHAGFVTGVFTADGNFGLCCDRRGDPAMVLCRHDEALEMWGSLKHINLVNDVNVKKCPRCTYSHVNEIFENVIVHDNMGYYFI